MDLSERNVIEIGPAEAWEGLAEEPDAALVDVRTRPEWIFVGLPDLTGIGRSLALVEWRRFPDMALNGEFADEVAQRLGGTLPGNLYFLCRSGQRSREAARHVLQVAAEQGIEISCFNVSEGFEGDLDAHGHRGSVNGWKTRGLAWRQR